MVQGEVIKDNRKSPEEIRDELKDYYGTAIASGLQMALINLQEIDDLDENELSVLASEVGII